MRATLVIGWLIAISAAMEWQTGLDETIKNQPSLERTSNYPLHLIAKVHFERIFSGTPEVLIMFEQFGFQNGKDVDVSAFVGDVSSEGFELRYRLGGPATVNSMKVRWVAFIEESVRVIY